MILDISIEIIKKPAPVREFSFFFMLFYLVFLAYFSRLTQEKKNGFISFAGILSSLYTIPENTYSSLKDFLLYFLFFAFVWGMYALLLINSPFVRHLLAMDIFPGLLSVWISGILFIFVKSFISIFNSYVFSIPGFGFSFVITELKTWIAFSFIIFPFAVLQLNPEIHLPPLFVLSLASLPLVIIFIQKLILLNSLKEYSWFIKILYLCSVELILVYIFIKLIIRFL